MDLEYCGDDGYSAGTEDFIPNASDELPPHAKLYVGQ